MSSPKPFYKTLSNIKAFVLGCDPTAFDKNGNQLEFEIVFDLGKDNRYFRSIQDNLDQLNISKDNIYVQNLVTDYQNEETSKNNDWERIAKEYIPQRKEEFDDIDPTGKIPVLLSSEVLYKVLIKPDQVIYPAKDLYNNPNLIPVTASVNQLERPLIPLYRHRNYSLLKNEDYKKRLLRIFNS